MTKAKTITIGVVAGILLALLWYFLLWSPQGTKLDAARQRKDTAQQEAAQLETRLNRLRSLDPAQVEADRQLLATLIPPNDQLDQFILQLNDRAKVAGIELVSISPQPPAAPTPGTPAAAAGGAAATPVSMSLQLNGDYFAILRFLEQMRDGPRLFTVDGLNMSSASGASGKITASVTARVFVNQSTTAAPPAVPVEASA